MGNEASTLMNELQTNIENKLERLQPIQINARDDDTEKTCPEGSWAKLFDWKNYFKNLTFIL